VLSTVSRIRNGFDWLRKKIYRYVNGSCGCPLCLHCCVAVKKRKFLFCVTEVISKYVLCCYILTAMFKMDVDRSVVFCFCKVGENCMHQDFSCSNSVPTNLFFYLKKIALKKSLQMFIFFNFYCIDIFL